MLPFFKKKKPVVTVDEKDGFDNPLSDPAGDQLGRKRFAEQVYSHLTNLEADWSVRVGLLAPWGEGKSTVASWVAKRAEEEGHIVASYKPWAARTDAELMLGLYNTITKALKDKNIEFGKSGLGIVANVSNHKITKNLQDAHKFAQAGIGVFQAFANITSEDIEKLTAALNGKRIIVIVDDLDRVDPNLIPRLLMSLRDLMDIKGFSFLLPFDDHIISASLTKYNQAEGFGENFLEKILDYRVQLPTATNEQVLTFFKHEVQKYCPFIKSADFSGLAGLLPANPRKLKGLVRRFRVFESEGQRHRGDELDWNALIFAEMIRLEDEDFFRAYVKDTFFVKETDNPMDRSAINPWTEAAFEKDKAKAEAEEKKRIERLLDETSVPLKDKRARLIDLCEGWRTSYGFVGEHKILYVLKLLDQPETLTWAEFDAFYVLWSKNHSIDDVLPWVKAHAEKMEKTETEIIKELFITSTQQYNVHLEAASSVMLQEEHEGRITSATQILKLIVSLFDYAAACSSSKEVLECKTFEQFLKIIETWFHFRGNDSDRQLRLAEEGFLRNWVKHSVTLGLGPDYRNVLRERRRNAFGEKDNYVKFYTELMSMTGSDIESLALEALKKEGGISAISPSGKGEEIKTVLLDVNSAIWQPVGTSAVEKILLSAATDPAVQKNARRLIELIFDKRGSGTWHLTSEQVRGFDKHPDLIVALWNAAIATPLQYRHLTETRQLREGFISRGVSPEQLRVPEWLLKSKKEGEEFTPPEKAASPAEKKQA